MDCGLLGMLLCWRREPGCSCVSFLSHFLWRLLCMCDKIGSKTGIARVCSLLSHVLPLLDVWQRAEGGWYRRWWNSLTLSFSDYRGQEIIYDIERVFSTYPEEKLEYKCECARLKIWCAWRFEPCFWVLLSNEATVVSHLVSQIWFDSDDFYASIVLSVYIFETSVHAHIVTVKDWRSTSYHWLLQMCNIESDAASLLLLDPIFRWYEHPGKLQHLEQTSLILTNYCPNWNLLLTNHEYFPCNGVTKKCWFVSMCLKTHPRWFTWLAC